MIDLHIHILPGLDDGARDEEQFLAMAREASRDGITAMIATPHHRDGVFHNPKEKVLSAVERANLLLEEHQISLRIYPGQEIRVYEDLVADLQKKELLTLDPSEKYLLLELPAKSVPHNMERLIYDLRMQGITPIIPHPERNSMIRERPNLLYQMVKAGALAQLTAASLIGNFGKSTEKLCYELLDHSLVHFIATDAHDSEKRPPILSEAYQKLEAYGGSELALQFQKNARSVLEGKEIWTEEPVKIQKKRFFGFF